jgi:hypothetical protein
MKPMVCTALPEARGWRRSSVEGAGRSCAGAGGRGIVVEPGSSAIRARGGCGGEGTQIRRCVSVRACAVWGMMMAVTD